MKKWNTPSIQELNLSATMMHGSNPKYVDFTIYDAERNTNWSSYSGGEPNTEATSGQVTINP